MKLKLWSATLCCGLLMAASSAIALADPPAPVRTTPVAQQAGPSQPTTVQTTNGDFVEYFSVPPPAGVPPVQLAAPPPSYNHPQPRPYGPAPGLAAPPVPSGNSPLSTNPYPFGYPDPELDAGYYFGAGYGPGYGYPGFFTGFFVPPFRGGFDHDHNHDHHHGNGPGSDNH